MAVNEKLVRETIKLIESDLEHWSQNSFVGLPPRNEPICGTTLCFAGFACVAAEGAGKFFSEVLLFNPIFQEWGVVGNVGDRAMSHLGLDWDQAQEIFYTFTNDLDEFKAVITAETGVLFDDEEDEDDQG